MNNIYEVVPVLSQVRIKLSFFVRYCRYLNSVQFKNVLFVYYLVLCKIRILSENWSKGKSKCDYVLFTWSVVVEFSTSWSATGGLFFGDPACTFVLPVISYFKLDRESIHCCIISFSVKSFYSFQQVFREKCWCLLICFLSYKCAYAWFVVKLALLTALNVICIAQEDCYVEQMWSGVVILCNYHH